LLVSFNNNFCKKGFVVIAYGKLGGLEFGYGLDLDMVFIYVLGLMNFLYF